MIARSAPASQLGGRERLAGWDTLGRFSGVAVSGAAKCVRWMEEEREPLANIRLSSGAHPFPEVALLSRVILLRLAASPRVEQYVRRSRLSAGLVRRFIAGDSPEAAATAVRDMNRRGMSATLDYLGENVTNAHEARESAESCLNLIRFIHSEELDANVSVKLTQLGLDISTNLAVEHMRSILRAAEDAGQFVRIDMEASRHVDPTLAVYRALWTEHRKFGLVFQSYLYRTEADVEQAIADGVRVRLVKGAYDEPASVAYRRKSDVDASFVRLAERLLTAGDYPAIATHDARLIQEVKNVCRRRSITSDRYEFQMLYGIRRDLQEALVREGFRMRIYTPFGTKWYGYSMRRLAERPANIWFVLKNLLRR